MSLATRSLDPLHLATPTDHKSPLTFHSLKQVLHRRPGKQHLNSHMTTRHKKRLGGERQIGRQQIPLIKGLLPHHRKSIR